MYRWTKCEAKEWTGKEFMLKYNNDVYWRFNEFSKYIADHFLLIFVFVLAI